MYTDGESNKNWKLWNIRKLNLDKFIDEKFKLKGNKKRQTIISVLKNKSKKRLRSETEIIELVNNFLEITTVKLSKIELNSYVTESIKGYNANEIYDRESDIMRSKKDKLYLYFQKQEESKYLYDDLSFLLTNVEYFYPEYDVRGVLKWT